MPAVVQVSAAYVHGRDVGADFVRLFEESSEHFVVRGVGGLRGI